MVHRWLLDRDADSDSGDKGLTAIHFCSGMWLCIRLQHVSVLIRRFNFTAPSMTPTWDMIWAWHAVENFSLGWYVLSNLRQLPCIIRITKIKTGRWCKTHISYIPQSYYLSVFVFDRFAVPSKTLVAESEGDGGVTFTAPFPNSTIDGSIFPSTNAQWWNFQMVEVWGPLPVLRTVHGRSLISACYYHLHSFSQMLIIM